MYKINGMDSNKTPERPRFCIKLGLIASTVSITLSYPLLKLLMKNIFWDLQYCRVDSVVYISLTCCIYSGAATFSLGETALVNELVYAPFHLCIYA
jgi:hypothetical protein